MQLQQLRYFLEIAKEKSISAAAKNLYISQPSLSQQIINLEKELGIPLLIRHSKSVSLSEAGEQFLIHAQRIVGETTQLSELMHKHSILQEGTLRIGMLWIAGYINLFQVLADYRKPYTNLKYDLKIDGTAILLDQLLKRNLHSAFIIGSDEQFELQKDLFFRRIMMDRYVAIVSSEHPFAGKKSLSLRELHNVPVIMPSKASAFYRQLVQYFEQYHITPTCICETSQSDTVVRLAAQNFGVGFSSDSIARSIQTKEFQIIPLEEAIVRRIYYVTLKELLDYPSIRSFTRYVTHYPFDRLNSEEKEPRKITK